MPLLDDVAKWEVLNRRTTPAGGAWLGKARKPSRLPGLQIACVRGGGGGTCKGDWVCGARAPVTEPAKTVAPAASVLLRRSGACEWRNEVQLARKALRKARGRHENKKRRLMLLSVGLEKENWDGDDLVGEREKPISTQGGRGDQGRAADLVIHSFLVGGKNLDIRLGAFKD